jgi:hypothetical protein
MDFAARVATDPGAIAAIDVDRLRAVGLSDREVFHVILAVCARRFFAGAIATASAAPDAALEPVAALIAA